LIKLLQKGVSLYSCGHIHGKAQGSLASSRKKRANNVFAIGEIIESKGCYKKQIKQAFTAIFLAFILGILYDFENAWITFERFRLIKTNN